jgi:hypothetical protein
MAASPTDLPFGLQPGERQGQLSASDVAATNYLQSLPAAETQYIDWLGNGGLRTGFTPSGQEIPQGFMDKFVPMLTAVMGGALAPELAAGFGPGLAGTIEGGALSGALTSGALTGNPLKGALTGGVGAGLNAGLQGLGVGNAISQAAGGGQFGNMLSNIATKAISGGVMSGVQGQSVGRGALAGAEAGFIGSLANQAMQQVAPGMTPGLGTSTLTGAASGALQSALKGGSPLIGALGGAISSDVGYGLNQLDSALGVPGGMDSKLLNAALMTALSQAAQPSQSKTAPAATSTASTPPPAAGAAPTPTTKATTPEPPADLGSSLGSSPSKIDATNPTVAGALGRADSYGGNK